MAALSRVSTRLTELLEQFSALEMGEQVTLRDLTQVAHRLELARRLSSEMQFHIDLLGVEGRMVALQHAELAANFSGLGDLIEQDYAPTSPTPTSSTSARCTTSPTTSSSAGNWSRSGSASGPTPIWSSTWTRAASGS
nr:hypothetical protein [Tessaracoccus coleopterorum]